MDWILENIKVIAGGSFIGIFLSIGKFVSKHKEIVSWIALRIEKDSADGKWTSAEKEKMAVELYFNQIIPMLPIQWKLVLKMVPNFVEANLVKSLVKKLCKKTKKVHI